MRLNIFFAGLFLTATQSVVASSFDDIAFLQGCWSGRDPDGSNVNLEWKKPVDLDMVGTVALHSIRYPELSYAEGLHIKPARLGSATFTMRSTSDLDQFKSNPEMEQDLIPGEKISFTAFHGMPVRKEFVFDKSSGVLLYKTTKKYNESPARTITFTLKQSDCSQ
jgi:hypothetical protein